MDPVREHYDRQAWSYTRRFSRGPLALVREREWRVVRELLGAVSGQRLLDAGCGAGMYSTRLTQLGARVRGVDLSPRMVEAARADGVEATVADLVELELRQAFDKILCAGALEFCSNPSRVLERLAAHLQPHGRLVLLYPTDTALGRVYRAYHARSGVRVRLFDAHTVAGNLERVGLRVVDGRRATPLSAVMSAERP